jgi:hypothetical protein
LNGVSSPLLALFATASLHAFPPAEESKEAKIHRLLEVTGAVDIEQSRSLFEAGMGQAADSLSPAVKDRVWREFVTAFPREEALSRIVDVYDDVFTERDIEGLLTFYETPLGQKVALTQEELTTRTILAFEELSARTAREITSKLFYALEGDTLRAAGQLDAAIESFRKAVRLYPDDPVFREILARTLAAAGRGIEARIELEELSRLRPGTWIDADALPFVGLWQFEAYAVWIEIFEDGLVFQCRIDPDGTVFQSEGTVRDGKIFWQQLWGTETITRSNEGITVGKDGREIAFTISRTRMDEACEGPVSLEARRDSSLRKNVVR